VLTAGINQVTQTKPKFAGDKSVICLGFDCPAEFPSNIGDRIERTIGTEISWGYTEHTAADVTLGKDHLLVFRDENMLIAKLEGQWEPDAEESIARKLENSLQFVFAHRMFAEVESFSSNDRSRRCIRSVQRTRLQARTLKPLHAGAGLRQSDLWILLDAYYSFLRNGEDNSQTELRRWTSEVVEAGNAPIEIQSLVLGVAVEGVARLLPVDAASHGTLTKALDVAVEVLESTLDDKQVRARCIGAINAMRRPRPRDALERLAASGEVPNEYVRSWVRLRNQSAHAESVDTDDVDELIEHIHRVHALFYCLIFKLIGYRGSFTDYGAPNWPIAIWPNDLKTGR
jgi:hypothetical protein